MTKYLTIVLFTVLTKAAMADIQLPAIINSNMVLQQQSTVKLWGWADPNEKVYVTTSWNNRLDSVATTRDANWLINIQTPAAGGPYKITLKGNNTIVLDNVMIGEVWICSGQSNMEMSYNWGLPDVKEALPTCSNANIRFFQMAKLTSTNLQDDCKGNWSVCDSNSLKSFSAVAYFFGRKLNKDLNVPIGLINASWGGTPAEVWTPAELVNDDPILKASADKLQPHEWWPYKPGYTFNAMIRPIVNYNISGAIWYQGEGNTDASLTYDKLLVTMIDAWRKAWNEDFPFYYVQIAPFNYGSDNHVGSLLREAQTKVMSHENVGMVVITDLVDDTADIHPKNKHDVGARLANWALAENYHKNDIVYKSPMYKAMTVQKNKAEIEIDYAPTGIVSTDKKIKEIYIAGADKIFYPAEAKIENNKLIVWNKQVPEPAAVRYGFSNAAIGNLFSKEGLPLCPFRTDSWEVDKSEAK